VPSVVRGPLPHKSIFCQTKQGLCLDKKNVLFAFCLHNKLEHRTSSLKSSCRQTGFNPANNRAPVSWYARSHNSLSWTNQKALDRECGCVCVCVHCFQCEISRVLISVGWVLGTGTQTHGTTGYQQNQIPAQHWSLIPTFLWSSWPIIVLSLHPVTKLPNSLLTSGPPLTTLPLGRLLGHLSQYYSLLKWA
jgi:hypothetical protein